MASHKLNKKKNPYSVWNWSFLLYGMGHFIFALTKKTPEKNNNLAVSSHMWIAVVNGSLSWIEKSHAKSEKTDSILFRGFIFFPPIVFSNTLTSSSTKQRRIFIFILGDGRISQCVTKYARYAFRNCSTVYFRVHFKIRYSGQPNNLFLIRTVKSFKILLTEMGKL